MKYKSKISVGLMLFIIGAPILTTLPFLLYDFSWLGVGLIVGLLCAAFYLLFSISYTIEGETLIVRCAFMPKKKYLISDIKRIEKTRSLLSAPAASLDRIAISFSGKSFPLVISPKDEAMFIEALKKINPEISLQGL